MKKLIIVSLLIISALQCYAQTTIEEWNYITKGYKIQKESGLDMKKGYDIIFSKRQTQGNIVCDFSFLIKTDGINSEKVAIIVHTNYQGNNYYCIPKFGNDDVSKLYQNQISIMFRTRNPVLTLMTWQLSNYINWN